MVSIRASECREWVINKEPSSVKTSTDLHNDHFWIHNDGGSYDRSSPDSPILAVPLLVGPNPAVYNTSAIDYRNTGKKPPHSYAKLIYMAIANSAEEQMELAHIYGWIEDNYVYYRTVRSTWHTSIRQNLRFNKAFHKLPSRSGHQKGKSLWSIRPEAKYQFTDLRDEKEQYNCDYSSIRDRSTRIRRSRSVKHISRHLSERKVNAELNISTNNNDLCLGEIRDNSSNAMLLRDSDVVISSREIIDIDIASDTGHNLFPASQQCSSEVNHAICQYSYPFSMFGGYFGTEESTNFSVIQTLNPVQCHNSGSSSLSNSNLKEEFRIEMFEFINELEIN